MKWFIRISVDMATMSNEYRNNIVFNGNHKQYYKYVVQFNDY